jgi:hypothetical protein
VDIIAYSVLIPPKYRINYYAKLNYILLINIVGVYLEVFKLIYYSLLYIELYLPLPSLIYNLALILTLF